MQDVFLSKNLTQIHAAIWNMLEKATKSFRAPFHAGTIATINGNMPEVRTVIVRRVATTSRSLFFHTDIRSAKIQQMKQHPQVGWLFYDEHSRIQLRMNATAIIHTDDDIANCGWEHSRLASKLCYSTSSPSGTELESPELIDLNRTEVDELLLEKARQNFCVVETKLHNMDWVFLHHSGNRRAYFDYETGQQTWKQV